MEGPTATVTHNLFVGPFVGSADDAVLIALIFLLLLVVVGNGREIQDAIVLGRSLIKDVNLTQDELLLPIALNNVDQIELRPAGRATYVN